MKNQKIIWFQDSFKFPLPESKWQTVDQLTNKLIDLVGNPDFDHQIVDPQLSFKELITNLNLDQFSIVIDLSGFLKPKIKALIHREVIDKFHLSRLRKLSSPKLDGIGHLVSLSTNEIQSLKDNFDFSNILFLDDVAWSGKTALLAAKLFGAKPESASFAFLSLNEGNFGIDKKKRLIPGAKLILENAGFKVFSGNKVCTPLDDGFHLKDFIGNPMIASEDGFEMIINLAEAKRLPEIQQNDKITRFILDSHANAFDTQKLLDLLTEGKAICPNGIGPHGIFGIEPVNWLMPSFLKRTDLQKLKFNRSDIIKTLQDFQHLKNEDREPVVEIKREFISLSLERK